RGQPRRGVRDRVPGRPRALRVRDHLHRAGRRRRAPRRRRTWGRAPCARWRRRSEEHTSELQSQSNLVCRLLLEKKKKKKHKQTPKKHIKNITNTTINPCYIEVLVI